MPPDPTLLGPTPAQRRDIEAINQLFAEAFTERYRRDGLTGVRVPRLNPRVWEYAIRLAGDGAMLWHDRGGGLVAFNMVHCAGRQGWMGPLAVRTDHQQMGVGRRIVQAGVSRLRTLGARTIGLETMPRTVDNIGFYARLGFRPGPLTITMHQDTPQAGPEQLTALSTLAPPARATALAAMQALTEQLAPGADLARAVDLTLAMQVGDLSLLTTAHGTLDGFALWQNFPLVPGPAVPEVRVLKLGAVSRDAARRLMIGLEGLTQRVGGGALSVRCQSDQSGYFGDLIARGYRVSWTDLRLTLEGFPEPTPGAGVWLSNWEI